jgi:hypothetical protein
MKPKVWTEGKIAAAQTWRAGGETINGAELAIRMVERGTLKTLNAILDYRVGDCLKTGVSAWTRVA